MVGALLKDDVGNDSGAAYVFVKPIVGWSSMTQTAKLTASDSATGDLFGTSVSIFDDVILVGADCDDDKGNDSGSVYVFTKPTAGWAGYLNEYDKLIPSDTVAGDSFGQSVAISGNKAIIGAPGDDDYGLSSGSAYIYDLYLGNRTPVAESKTVSTSEDYSVSISLSGSDEDHDNITYSIVSYPSHGTLLNFNPSSGLVIYNPTSNYYGSDSFTYQVNDGTVDSNIAAVRISISSVNDPPSAQSQSVSTDENQSVNITLTGNDRESSVTFNIVSNPSHGAISNFNSSSGTLT